MNLKRFFLLLILMAACQNKGPVAITTLAGYDGQPRMAPDGQTIVYVTSQSGDRHIWAYDRKEQLAIPLTFNEGSDEDVCFSPDGERLIFTSRIHGQNDLWILSPNDELLQVTKTDSADETSPFWAKDDGIWFVRKAKSYFEIARLSAKNVSDVKTVLTDTAILDFPVIAGDRLFFEKRDRGNRRIYSATTDGHDATLFTPDSCGEPSVSADGQWLAYTMPVGHWRQVVATRTDRFSPVILTSDPVHHSHPSWSPDGRSVLYEATPGWDIKIIDVKTQKDSLLVSGPYDDENPVLSADGKFLYFISDRSGVRSSYRLDMSNGRVETSVDSENIFARISGEKTVYESNASGSWDLWVKDPRSNKRLTVDPRSERSPSFASGGRTVFFQANWAGRWSIWQMPVEGGLPAPVTRDRTPYGMDADPEVSPDGQWLLFTRSWYDDADIWLMSLSGGEKTARTLSKDNTNQEARGRWSSDGKKIVFQVGRNTDVWMKDVSALIKN